MHFYTESETSGSHSAGDVHYYTESETFDSHSAGNVHYYTESETFGSHSVGNVYYYTESETFCSHSAGNVRVDLMERFGTIIHSIKWPGELSIALGHSYLVDAIE